MKIPIRNIFGFVCFAVLVCTASCATSDKSKNKKEEPLKSIHEVIGSPKDRIKATERNKVIWRPQDRFLDNKSTQEKIKIWEVKPE